jgi:hypothetical protein
LTFPECGNKFEKKLSESSTPIKEVYMKLLELKIAEFGG